MQSIEWLMQKKTSKIKMVQTFLFIGIISTFIPGWILGDSDSHITWTKREIAFFKWGKGEKQVRLKVVKRGTTNQFYWPNDLQIDGVDNVYIMDGNDHTLVIAPDGSSIKTLNVGSFRSVDEAGNIYGLYTKAGEQRGLLLTKPDGEQITYKNFDFNHEENGVAYDFSENKAITILDSKVRLGKLPPHLISRPKSRFGPAKLDYGRTSYNSFVIYTKKINNHLKKINRQIDEDKINIKVDSGKDLGWTELLGVDDSGNFYFLAAYPLASLYKAWSKATVIVYSARGQKLAEVPIDLDYFDKHVSGIALNTQGNYFQLLASEDGIHILKWIKN